MTDTNNLPHDKEYNEAAIHDRYVRLILSRKESFKAFLKHFAPHVYESLDLESLQLVNVSFIDENLKPYFSDIIYEGNLATSPQNTDKKTKRLSIAMLIEHKSSPYEDIAFQVHNYIHNYWYQNKRQEAQITPIIPIIIYHGKRPWQPKTIREHFEDILPEKLLDYLPNFKMVFVDFTRLSEEQVVNLLDDVYLLVMVNLLKEIWRGPIEAFKILINRVIIRVGEFSEVKDLFYDALLEGLKYLSQFRNFDYETAKQVFMEVKTLTPQSYELEINEESPFGQLAKWLMEVVEKSREEGREAGWKEGLLFSGYRLYRRGLEIDEIVELLGIEKDELIRFIEEKEKGKDNK